MSLSWTFKKGNCDGVGLVTTGTELYFLKFFWKDFIYLRVYKTMGVGRRRGRAC